MDLAAALSEIRSKVGLILLMAAAAGIAAYAVSTAMPKTYTSEARVLVGSLVDSNYDQLLAYGQLAQTYTQLATTTPVLAAVSAELGLDETAEELARRVDVRTPTGLSIIQVSASAPTAESAAALANAVAEQITDLSKQSPPATGNLAAVVQRADPPPSSSSPRVLLNTVVAMALGLGLGVLMALIPGYRRSSAATSARRVDLVTET